MKNIRSFLWGIVLIGIGVILGGNSIGVFNVNLLFNGWWTLIIIIPNVIDLFSHKDKVGNVIAILIGVILLLSCRGLLNMQLIWKLLVPFILIILGISIIFKDTINSKINSEIKRINKDNKGKNEYCATFSGQDLKFDNQEFNGATIDAIFGGVKFDISRAIINNDQVINCSSVFGGIDILVPDNVNIEIKSSSIFGGVSNKKNTENVNGNKVIYINAKCIFGGVDIK